METFKTIDVTSTVFDSLYSQKIFNEPCWEDFGYKYTAIEFLEGFEVEVHPELYGTSTESTEDMYLDAEFAALQKYIKELYGDEVNLELQCNPYHEFLLTAPSSKIKKIESKIKGWTRWDALERIEGRYENDPYGVYSNHFDSDYSASKDLHQDSNHYFFDEDEEEPPTFEEKFAERLVEAFETYHPWAAMEVVAYFQNVYDCDHLYLATLEETIKKLEGLLSTEENEESRRLIWSLDGKEKVQILIEELRKQLEDESKKGFDRLLAGIYHGMTAAYGEIF